MRSLLIIVALLSLAFPAEYAFSIYTIFVFLFFSFLTGFILHYYLPWEVAKTVLEQAKKRRKRLYFPTPLSVL